MRPLSVGEVLDASFSSFRRNFGRLCLAVLFVVGPIAIIQTLVLASIGSFDDTDTGSLFSSDFDTSSSSGEELSGAEVAGFVVIVVLLALNQLLAPAACLRIVGADILGQRVTAPASMRFALRRLPRLIWALLIVFVFFVLLVVGAAIVIAIFSLAGPAGVVLAVLAVIPVFVWLGVSMAMAVPVALYEDTGGFKVLRRSFDLIRGFWWRTFGTLAVIYIIASIIQQILSAVVLSGAFLDTDNNLLAAVFVTLSTTVGYLISLPLLAATNAYIYFDLRVRKEGFDLMLEADRIAAAPATSTEVEGLPPREPPPAGGGGFLPPQAPDG